MFSKFSLALLLALALASTVQAIQQDQRVLFDFSSAEAGNAWTSVNDGVMGGLSTGRFKVTDQKQLRFFGNLSLDNNGGFASIRGRLNQAGMETGQAILARVKGDGRKYSFNAYTRDNFRGYSYRMEFATKKNEWVEVKIPLDKMTATWRGRKFPNEQLEAGQIRGIGIVLGDKKEGPFELLVDWIKVVPAADAD